MGTQGTGRKRHPNRERLSAEDHALNQIAREAEARLAAKRAARAEAREIRMKELERQQKEIYQVQKKYYGLDAKWGDIEQWMASDEDDLMSVTSRSSLRTNGYEEELLGASQYRKSSRSSTGSGETLQSSQGPPRDEAMSAYYSDLNLASAPLTSKSHQQPVQNGSRPSLLNCNSLPSRSQRGSLYDEGLSSGSRRSSSSRPPSEYSCYLGSGSRASSRASSARASPVSSEPTGPSMFRRGSNSTSVASLNHLDDVSIPAMSRVEERPDKDFGDKSSRPVSSLSAATLASLGGTSSRRGSGDTSLSVDTEASIREIKDSLAEVEEKYKRSMVTNAQLDNEKSSLQYQVDMMRDVLMELEEELAETRRLYDEKHKECERQKHDQTVLRFQLAEMKEALEQREELLTKHGIALDSENTPNGDTSVEPQVNSDSRPDPPIRVTSMGQSEEVEKMEAMSVVCEIPPSKHEENTEEVLQEPSSETPLPVEVRGSVKEECLHENDINTNSTKLEPTLNDPSSDSMTGLEQLKAVQPLDSESLNNEKEIIVDNCAQENLDDSGETLPKEDAQENLNQNDMSPVDGEEFQDALDVQPHFASSPLNNEPEGNSKTEDVSNSQQELAISKERCESGSKSETENGTSEISEYKNDNAADVQVNASDVCAEDEDEHETSSTDSSSKYDSGDNASNETVSTDEENEQADEEKEDLEEASVDVEQGLQNSGENPGETNSDMVSLTDKKASDAVPTCAVQDEGDHKISSISEQPLQGAQDKKEEEPLIELEDSQSFDIPDEKASDPVPTGAVQDVDHKISSISEQPLQGAHDKKEEPLIELEDSKSFEIHDEKASDAVPTCAVQDDGDHKISSISEQPLQGAQDKKEEEPVMEQEARKSLEIPESNFLSNCESNVDNKAVKEDIDLGNDHQEVSEDVTDDGSLENVSEGTEKNDKKISPDTAPDQVKQDQPSEPFVECENSNYKSLIDSDTVSSEGAAPVSSEGESGTEGDDGEEEEEDDHENVAERSEKYTGESLPLGSSVDRSSMDDIRMEDGSDKAQKKGKGKNKDECVVS